MAHRLLQLPPELLAQILALLPVRDLLKFSETSRYAHSLANSNLRTLAFGIQPIRPWRKIRTSGEIRVRIPDARTYDYATLLNFHTALTKSVLNRHGDMLQTLVLSLWTLTTPIARAISHLSALRSLSVTIEDLYSRAVPRTCMAIERLQQREAWNLLGQTAVWRDRLRALKVKNADLTTSHLGALLQLNRCCKELWLSKCKYVCKELWDFLGSEWQGRTALQRLRIAECCGVLDEKALNTIGKLSGLQYLNMYGCYGSDSKIVEEWNKNVWHISEVIPPGMATEGINTVLEVDMQETDTDTEF